MSLVATVGFFKAPRRTLSAFEEFGKRLMRGWSTVKSSSISKCITMTDSTYVNNSAVDVTVLLS